jgi:hypothetical protein
MNERTTDYALRERELMMDGLNAQEREEYTHLAYYEAHAHGSAKLSPIEARRLEALRRKARA